MKMHHVGIIVKSIEDSLSLYEQLGYKVVDKTIVDTIQNNRLQFVQSEVDGHVIELIQPLDDNSSVKNAVQGYHHICYEVESLDEYIEKFRSAKIGKVFTGKITAPAFGNRRIMFAYLKNQSILEFLENKNGK